jgi:hypothetical protein
MWFTVGIISAVILVLVVWWFINSRPKAMNAEERLKQLGHKYEANPTVLPTRKAEGVITTEIVDGPTNPPGPRRRRTIEEIKKDILREQELEEARKEQ